MQTRPRHGASAPAAGRGCGAPQARRLQRRRRGTLRALLLLAAEAMQWRRARTTTPGRGAPQQQGPQQGAPPDRSVCASQLPAPCFECATMPQAPCMVLESMALCMVQVYVRPLMLCSTCHADAHYGRPRRGRLQRRRRRPEAAGAGGQAADAGSGGGTTALQGRLRALFSRQLGPHTPGAQLC
jgi:hypothetical protein